jgi:hypothetical protein
MSPNTMIHHGLDAHGTEPDPERTAYDRLFCDLASSARRRASRSRWLVA